MELHKQTLLIPQIPPKAWVACYLDENHPAATGNHYIDVLRPTLDGNALIKNLRNTEYIQALPEDPDFVRKRSIHSLTTDFFVPVPEAQDIYDKIDLAIKGGYIDRCATGNDYAHQQGNLSIALRPEMGFWRDVTQSLPRRNVTSITGCSKTGKSMVIKRLLATYPQVIWHQKTAQVQIVYIPINLKGATNALAYCETFLIALEAALGNEKFETEVAMAPNIKAAYMKIRSLLITYNVGLVVVDSIQTIDKWKYEERVNFLEHLDGLGDIVPLLLINNTNSIFEMGDICQTNIDWDPLMRFSDSKPEMAVRWNLFSRQLWKRQCLRNSDVELSAEISDEWFYSCEGIVGLAVIFFVSCQLEAINSGQEQITVELMKRVRRKEFRLQEEFLSQIRDDKLDIYSRIKKLNDKKKRLSSLSLLSKTQKKHKPQSKEFTQRSDFKKIPKKYWDKLPEDDLRHIFSKYEGEHFYQAIKKSGLVLTMTDLLTDAKFSKPVSR
jgi:hypothetical protein